MQAKWLLTHSRFGCPPSPCKEVRPGEVSRPGGGPGGPAGWFLNNNLVWRQDMLAPSLLLRDVVKCFSQNAVDFGQNSK